MLYIPNSQLLLSIVIHNIIMYILSSGRLWSSNSNAGIFYILYVFYLELDINFAEVTGSKD